MPTCSAGAGPRLLTAAKDRLAVRVWSETDLESGPGWVLEAEWRCGPAEVTFGPRFCWITGLVVCASGLWAAASRYDGQVDLFWLEEDESSSTHRITDHPIVCLAVARGYLVTGHFDGSVNLVHIAGRDRGVVGIATLLPSQQCAALYSACVRAVCADGAGRTLFTAGLDNRVRVWEWDRDATVWTQTDLLAGTEVSQGILALACLDEGNTTYLAAGCTVGVLTWTRESRGQGGWVRGGASLGQVLEEGHGEAQHEGDADAHGEHGHRGGRLAGVVQAGAAAKAKRRGTKSEGRQRNASAVGRQGGGAGAGGGPWG